MTDNMVFLGLAIAKHNANLMYHTGVAFIGYVIGSWSGAKVAGHAREIEGVWPRAIIRALAFEFAILAVFGIWWISVAGAPTPSTTYVMLGLNALALGVQSAALLRFGISGLSTTYLTGTLTQFVAGLTKRGEPVQGRSAMILLSLIVGAALGGVVALHDPRLAPLVPVGALLLVVVGADIMFHRRPREEAP